MLPFLAILSAIGEGANAVSQSSAIRRQGRYAQRIAERNALFAERSALESEQRGNVASSYAQGQNDQLVGDQRAALASQGLDPNSGTGLALQSDAKLAGALDIANIRTNAYREAYGFKTDALNLRTQGKLDRQASRFKAKNTLLNGALKILLGSANELSFSGGNDTDLVAPSGGISAGDIYKKGYAGGGGGLKSGGYSVIGD